MELAFLNIGTQEMILIVIVILLLFGGKKLPELARGLGKGIREFKDASDGIKREITDQINNFEKDLDVTKEESKTSASSIASQYEDPAAEYAAHTDDSSEVKAEEEKKFPGFSTPENTYQHDPGAHPVDQTDYYNYGYDDHFTAEKEGTVKNEDEKPDNEDNQTKQA